MYREYMYIYLYVYTILYYTILYISSFCACCGVVWPVFGKAEVTGLGLLWQRVTGTKKNNQTTKHVNKYIHGYITALCSRTSGKQW